MSYRTTEKSRDACATLAPRARVSRRCRYVGGHVPQPFEQFYRATLRFVVGSRMRRTEVHRLYCSWAAENEQESLNRRQVKRAMVSIGHGLIESNGMYYLDLGLASAFPDVPDNYPALQLPPGIAVANFSDRLGALIAELTTLRAEVARAGNRSLQTKGLSHDH